MSVSGLSTDENLQLLEKVKTTNVDLVELNVSCPNLIGKPQLGYDMDGFSEVLRKVSEMWDKPYDKPLGLKLPPYFDFNHFTQVADIIIENQPTIRFLTCCNSFGNGLYVDFETESTVIHPKNGFGGVGGLGLKATSLANVRKFYTLLNVERNVNVDIVGCGGIMNGKDVFEYILCGASAVQVGTELQHKGLSLFDDIQKDLVSIMDNKSYSNLNDFKGKLKTIEAHETGI
jgi:dihydroorotate dehydrogenase (fumarate)